jgi:hypothetical protein
MSVSRCFTLLCALVVSGPAQVQKVAVLDSKFDIKIIVEDGSGDELSLPHDERQKFFLRWLPDGQRISYLARASNGALGRLVIVDLTGKVLKEFDIRPPDQNIQGMRFIEKMFWVGADTVRIGGSINPRNCEIADLDVRTGREVNWAAGECWTFLPSPDGKHVAYRGLLGWGPDEDREDSIGIDREAARYSGRRGLSYPGLAPNESARAGHIQIVAGPVWSADSREVAIVERDLGTNEAAVTVLSIQGAVERTPIPISPDVIGEDDLEWVGSQPVVTARGKTVTIDRALRSARPALSEEITKLQQVREGESKRVKGENDALSAVMRVLQKLHGTQGAGWPAEVYWPQ